MSTSGSYVPPRPALPETGDTVTLEQLQFLLSLATETQSLDFKASCDLDSRVAIVELAKDVAAMQVDGGYIVVGADSYGAPAPPGIRDEDQQKFDEANLRPKLAKYLPQPFELRTAVHTIEDCTFAIIRVQPRPDGFCVFAADGIHEKNGKQTFVFRKGEVFVRHGTTNERWNQADISRIRKRMEASLKEAWWAEREEDQRRRGSVSEVAAQVTAKPLTSYSWHLNQEAFDAATLELLRNNDDIPLRRLLNEAAADATGLADSGDIDEMTAIVRRVVSLAGTAITYRRPAWFDDALATLAQIYRAGFDARGFDRSDGSSPDIWLIVLEHLLGLGALAVRKSDWRGVRTIALTPPGASGDFYASWIRHGFTMAARSSRLDDGRALITRAADGVAALPALRPDIRSEDDRVITSICQFDFLAVMAVIAETRNLTGSDWYPNFARFNSARSEPVAQMLIDGGDVRKALFPLPDPVLASALREVDRRSQNEGVQYSGWYGFDSERIDEFLNANPASNEAKDAS